MDSTFRKWKSLSFKDRTCIFVLANRQPYWKVKLLLTHHVLSHIKVLLAKRKRDGKCYAIKVLQKKVILNRREVTIFFVSKAKHYLSSLIHVLWHLINEWPWYSFHASKSTSWLSAMCCWRMLNTPSWLACTIPFRQRTSYTLFWILSMVEKWVLWLWDTQRSHLPYHISNPPFGRLNQFNVNRANEKSNICHCM